MGRQTDYFESIKYNPTYFIGDRVEGEWNGIPFVGTVANDSVVYVDRGPQVSIFVDLPICYENTVYNIITLKHEDIRQRK